MWAEQVHFTTRHKDGIGFNSQVVVMHINHIPGDTTNASNNRHSGQTTNGSIRYRFEVSVKEITTMWCD
jgi:hypothetical protein